MFPAKEELTSLIAEAKAGSKEAQGQVLERYRPYLRTKAMQLLDAGLRAKVGESDLVQDTLLRALKGFKEFHGCSPEQTGCWLARILKNRAEYLIRKYRGTRKRDLALERTLEKRDELQICQTDSDTDALVGDTKHAELLTPAFHLLSPDYQTVVRLHYREQKTFVETAELMDRSVDAVKKLWSRALRSWTKQVKRMEQENCRLAGRTD